LNRHSADDPIRAALGRDDPAAVALLWDRYAGDLLAFLQALLCSRHDAEDVLQTVFVRIVCKRRCLADARSLDGYVFQIARHEAASFVRVRRRRCSGDQWLEAAEVEIDAQPQEWAEELQAALTRLPQEQREIVVLKTYRDKTFQEIGEMLELSANTVASRYRYGIEKLRAILKDAML
jgi:RNA polymerase sigma-70 factor (ECF subfamily)